MSYHFVHAGIFPYKKSGIAVYTKFGKHHVNNLRVKHNHEYTWITAPDRELIIVSDAHKSDCFRPQGCNFDTMQIFGPTIPSFDGYDVDYMMTNYTTHIGKEHLSPMHRKQGFRDHTHPLAPDRATWMADSGGFQFSTGVLSFVDPINMVKWYNDNADIGMVLDMPVSREHGLATFKRAAHTQARNTAAMVAHKAEHLDLMNIIHGSTVEDRAYYRRVVERDDITKLAVAGDYNGTVLDVINNLLSLVNDTGSHYDHYHLLGIFNPRITALLAKVASEGIVDTLTSDSSTAIQAATVREFYVISKNEGLHRTPVGHKYIHPNISNRLPCSCPVCSTLKYTDVFTTVNSGSCIALLAVHNMFAMSTYMSMLDTYANTLSTEEYRSYLSSTIAKRGSGGQEMLHCIDFIESYKEEGLEAAQRKFQFYLDGNLGSAKPLPSMLGGAVEEEEPKEELSLDSDDDTPAAGKEEYHAHLQKVLGNFDRWAEGEDLSHVDGLDMRRSEKSKEYKERKAARDRGEHQEPVKKKQLLGMSTKAKQRAKGTRRLRARPKE